MTEAIYAYGIDGYNHVGITRSNQHGGGVSLFVCNEMLFSELTEFTKVLEYNECLFLKIKDKSYVIWIVYRPSKQRHRTIYWNIKWYTQSNNACTLLYNGRL